MAEEDAGPDTVDAADPPDAPPPECSETRDIESTEVPQPPDILIVLDRSGSMGSPLNSTPGAPSKWDTMVAALSNIAMTHEAGIHLGLSAFPTDDFCGVSPGALVNPGPSQAGALAMVLATLSPAGNTPAHLALDEALATFESVPENLNGRYVLFATDGMPNCESTDPSPLVTVAIENLAAAGIPTFVLGFGTGALANPTLLDTLALAGTLPKPGGPPHFYYADNPAELTAELETIVEQVAVPSCEFELDEVPDDPADLEVSADGLPIPRDPSHTNGWDLEGNVVTLYGAACDGILGGLEMSFSFGCGIPPVQ